MSYSDEQIADLLAEGILDPTALGLDWMEVRYFGPCMPSPSSPCRHDEETRNEYTVRYGKPSAFRRAEYRQESDSAACVNMWDMTMLPPEGIAAQFTGGGTVSYLSDDADLSARVAEYIGELMCLTCGAQTFPRHTDTAHEPNWLHD